MLRNIEYVKQLRKEGMLFQGLDFRIEDNGEDLIEKVLALPNFFPTSILASNIHEILCSIIKKEKMEMINKKNEEKKQLFHNEKQGKDEDVTEVEIGESAFHKAVLLLLVSYKVKLTDDKDSTILRPRFQLHKLVFTTLCQAYIHAENIGNDTFLRDWIFYLNQILLQSKSFFASYYNEISNRLAVLTKDIVNSKYTLSLAVFRGDLGVQIAGLQQLNQSQNNKVKQLEEKLQHVQKNNKDLLSDLEKLNYQLIKVTNEKEELEKYLNLYANEIMKTKQSMVETKLENSKILMQLTEENKGLKEELNNATQQLITDREIVKRLENDMELFKLFMKEKHPSLGASSSSEESVKTAVTKPINIATKRVGLFQESTHPKNTEEFSMNSNTSPMSMSISSSLRSSI